MPEYNNNPNYRAQQSGMPSGQMRPQGQTPRRPQQPVGRDGQIRRPSSQSSNTPAIRQAPPRRPSGGGNMRTPKRRRRPTPFLIIFIVFIIILLIVIFTSKSFRGLFDGADIDTDTETENETNERVTTDDTTNEDTTEEVTDEPTVTVAPPEADEFLICIDPGHGFGDGGASSELLGDVLEKDINLAVAKEVYELLKQAGYTVIMSHDGETFPKSPIDDGNELYYIDERVSYVNSKKVDLFVSIHCDTFEADTSVYGTRIYYSSTYKFAEAAGALAETVKRSVNEAFPDYKEARVFPKEGASAYYVTYETKAPAVLVEMGFISNEDDASRMLDPEWRSDMAYAIAQAVSVYLYESNSVTE